MSGAYCAVPGCGNKQYKTVHTNPDIKYYYFPKVDSPRRKRWLKFCNKPAKFKGYVCSAHFREEDFRQANVVDDPNFKRRLLPNAVPSIRPTNYEKHLKDHTEDDDGEVEEIDGVTIDDDDDLSSSLVERLSSQDMDHSNQPPMEEEDEVDEENQEIEEEEEEDHTSLLTPQTQLKDYLTDNDGFRVEFDSEIPEDERKFYMKKYSTVNAVRERRVHCTVCGEHIGTAPAQESNIRMHPILKVTHCGKCHDFYNSGEFSKGEDGSELYCRWCGQGGQVYCCAKCPYVFCYSCITNNLGKDCVRDIEENENWNCFACAPKIMWHLRSQHWALMNFIEKQKQSILSENASDSDIKRLMTKDMTTCCKHLKRPNSSASGQVSDGSASDSELSLSEIRKRALSSTPNLTNVMPVKKILPKPAIAEKRPMPKLIEAPTAKKVKLANNDEVVCTPDVLSMLQNANAPQGNNVQKTHIVRPAPALQPQPQLQQRQIITAQRQPAPQTIQPQILTVQSGSAATNIQSNNQQPPPLIIRNFNTPIRAVSSSVVARKTIVGARPPSTAPGQSPVYHTINGFRIDLNSAAQQETFRLPNGKLIQVKKQGFATGTQGNANQNNAIANTVQQVTIHNPKPSLNPRTLPNMTQQVNVQQGVQHFSIAQPSLATIRYATATTQGLAGTTTITTPSGTVIGQLLNGTAAATVQAQLTSRPTPIPTLVRQFFSATPLGQARTQLQNQIFSAMDICQHLTTKIHTLTNSNAYKSVGSYTDVKELYIHLSYLFTYAIGRFKTLQEKCLDDMRKLGFAGDAASLESGQMGGEKPTNSDADDDDIEIVEPKTTLIDLDSDDEEVTTKTTKTPAPVVANAAPAVKQFSNSALQNGDDYPPSVTPTTPTPSITPAEGESSMQGSYSETGSPESNNVSRQNSGQETTSVREPKKPRTKITNTPNPHLLKKQEMQQREKEKEEQRKIQDPKAKPSLAGDTSREENDNGTAEQQGSSNESTNKEKENSFGKTRVKVEDGEEVQEVLKVVEEISSGPEEEAHTDNQLQENSSKEKLHEDSHGGVPEKRVIPPPSEVQKGGTVAICEVLGDAEPDAEQPSAEATVTVVMPSIMSVASVPKGAFESINKDSQKTGEIADKTEEEEEEEEEDDEEDEEYEEEVGNEPNNAEKHIPNTINHEDEMDNESCSADMMENGDPVEYSEKGDDTMDDDNTETNLENEENSRKSRRTSLESESYTTETSQDQSQNSREPYNCPKKTNGSQAPFSALKQIDTEEDSSSKFDEEMEVDEVVESSLIETKSGEKLKTPHMIRQEAVSNEPVAIAVINETN